MKLLLNRMLIYFDFGNSRLKLRHQGRRRLRKWNNANLRNQRRATRKWAAQNVKENWALESQMTRAAIVVFGPSGSLANDSALRAGQSRTGVIQPTGTTWFETELTAGRRRFLVNFERLVFNVLNRNFFGAFAVAGRRNCNPTPGYTNNCEHHDPKTGD